MEKSNIIISIIIVICIAAGVTAYGLTSDDNGVFKSLQGIGTNTHGTGIGNNSTNVNTTNDISGNGGSGGISPYGTGDSPYGSNFYYGTSDNGGSDNGGSGDSGTSNQQTPIIDDNNNNNNNNDDTGIKDYSIAYTITTDNGDGTYTVTYYNVYDQSIGFHTYGNNTDEGGGGAPDHPYTG